MCVGVGPRYKWWQRWDDVNCQTGVALPTDYPLRSVSGRFGSVVVSRDCSCVEALSHLLDVNPRARVFETLPTKKELRLWLLQSKVELGEFYFNGGSEPEGPTLLRGRILWKVSTKTFRYLVAEDQRNRNLQTSNLVILSTLRFSKGKQLLFRIILHCLRPIFSTIVWHK